MGYYSDGFKVQELGTGTNAFPGKAHTYKSVEEAVSQYEEFVAETLNLDMGVPLNLWLYEGTPDGDEEQYGYPEFPDYIIYVEGGTILCEEGFKVSVKRA